MLPLSRINQKKALSNLIAYVILIAITLSLSVLVYNWLRFYVSEEEIPSCSDGVNVIITNYVCSPADKVEITLKNKGRFTVDGFTLRIHNRTDAEFGFYTLNETGGVIAPGDELLTVGDLDDPTTGTFNTVTLLEVQPFVMEGDKVSCKSLATQQLSC